MSADKIVVSGFRHFFQSETLGRTISRVPDDDFTVLIYYYGLLESVLFE